jgi:hypothetical protein
VNVQGIIMRKKGLRRLEKGRHFLECVEEICVFGKGFIEYTEKRWNNRTYDIH